MIETLRALSKSSRPSREIKCCKFHAKNAKIYKSARGYGIYPVLWERIQSVISLLITRRW
jgi:hypothetical protein